MFNKDFYPTPVEVIDQMIHGFDMFGKVVLEPSAGKGNIVDHLKLQGATVVACEKNKELQTILATKCKIISEDFLKVTREQISHVNFIIMNPPFSADEKHILHAWDIAPDGCTILTLCNENTFSGRYKHRANEKIRLLVEENGSYDDLGDCFSTAERKTNVEVCLLRLQKQGSSENEFNGFYMGEEPEQAEGQQAGLVPYNFIRDTVQRYIMAIQAFDEQIETAIKLNGIIEPFLEKYYDKDKLQFGFQLTSENRPVTRNNFKKDLQKRAWSIIFDRMKMDKYRTSALEEDMNKFVESQEQIPFTMRNIYRMLDIVLQTTGQRMDKALLTVFESLTQHYSENRFFVEGWKTNSHYLVNQKFIFPYGCNRGYSWEKSDEVSITDQSIKTLIDLEKSLCFITGENYDNLRSREYVFASFRKVEAGKWNYTHFFQFKCYKKGTVHCIFRDEDIWAKFNQKISQLKGFPLYEAKAPSSHKEGKEQTRRTEETAKRYRPTI